MSQSARFYHPKRPWTLARRFRSLFLPPPKRIPILPFGRFRSARRLRFERRDMRWSDCGCVEHSTGARLETLRARWVGWDRCWAWSCFLGIESKGQGCYNEVFGWSKAGTMMIMMMMMVVVVVVVVVVLYHCLYRLYVAPPEVKEF